MVASETYMSFLVRMWEAHGSHPHEAIPEWHSEVEHIQGGQQWAFHTLEELLGFFRQATVNPKVLTSHNRETN